MALRHKILRITLYLLRFLLSAITLGATIGLAGCIGFGAVNSPFSEKRFPLS